MKGGGTVAVCALVILLFASIGLNGFLVHEREGHLELLQKAKG